MTLLFSVRFLHNFYNLQDGRCTDFLIAPAPDSVQRMADLGLRFQQDRDGFGVYVATARVDALAEAACVPERTTDCNVLSFMLVASNPAFRTVTALPFAYAPAPNAIHACNTAATRRAGGVRLCAGSFVEPADLYPVVPAEFSVILPQDGTTLTVSDVSGQVVADSASTRVRTVAGIADIDLAGLPFGCYVVASTPAAAGYPKSVLYIPDTPLPTGWLDIALTRPEGAAGGVYPLPGSPRRRQAPVGGVQYQLPFNAVSTYWWYYVMSQDRASRLDGLAIHGKGATFEIASDPPPVPGDREATVLRSSRALPLRQKPALRFQLTGRRVDAESMSQAIRVDPLPLAPPAPVWPIAGTDEGNSEMFVYV